MAKYTAFFYGTLMHSKILKAVIRNDGSHLHMAPAVILNHTRHKIKNADYPGVIRYEQGIRLFTHELSQEERSVRGTVVEGLTERDMRYLDEFEGDEYTRAEVDAYPLAPFTKLLEDTTDIIPAHPAPLFESMDRANSKITAETYIFLDATRLEGELWSFDTFVQNNAHKWYDGTRQW